MNPHTIKARMPRTWSAFFERHGNYTEAQRATIPLLLDGHNIILCAPTASGKTEATIAPLVERHCPPVREPHMLRLLYLTPTRALVNDLLARLQTPLDYLKVSVAVRTHDLSNFRPERPAELLITTPESVDSLLASHASVFATLRAIIIDELHIFDGSPRGDHLRAILCRLHNIHTYAKTIGDTPNDTPLQYAALSATLNAPEQTATRYFAPAEVEVEVEAEVEVEVEVEAEVEVEVEVIRVAGTRHMEVDQIALSPYRNTELHTYLATFRSRRWRKALVFCNSRAEVESYAAAVRQRSPFGQAVYVHYSNIEAERRREIEQQFAQAEVAICFASTTLELGIDIGNVDVVILIGPPGTPASFLQRIGRGNRRQGTTHVCCCYRTPLEQALFGALTTTPPTTLLDHIATTPLRLSVMVQQIFSSIKQSPTGAVRLKQLANTFANITTADDLLALLGHLQDTHYLTPGRPGEWRAGERLNDLVDKQSSKQVDLSIHSNIQNNSAHMVTIRSQHTQREVARVDANWLHRDTLTLEGRPFNVSWCDGEALWVSSLPGDEPQEHGWYRSSRQFLSYDLARLLPLQLGLPFGSAPFVQAPDGWWWFHWLGDVYGKAALDLMRYTLPVHATPHIGLCLHIAGDPQLPPIWTGQQVSRYVADTYRQWESLLSMGAFHHLLPLSLRSREVVRQFAVPGFLAAMESLRPFSATESLAEDLMQFVEQG